MKPDLKQPEQGLELVKGTYEQARQEIISRVPQTLANKILQDLDAFAANHNNVLPNVELITSETVRTLFTHRSISLEQTVFGKLTFGNIASSATLTINLNTGNIEGISTEGTLLKGNGVRVEAFSGIKNDPVVIGSGEVGIKSVTPFLSTSTAFEVDPFSNVAATFGISKNVGNNGVTGTQWELKGNINEMQQSAAEIIVVGGLAGLAAWLLVQSAPVQAGALAAFSALLAANSGEA